jgi:hypothetical protein
VAEKFAADKVSVTPPKLYPVVVGCVQVTSAGVPSTQHSSLTQLSPAQMINPGSSFFVPVEQV